MTMGMTLRKDSPILRSQKSSTPISRFFAGFALDFVSRLMTLAPFLAQKGFLFFRFVARPKEAFEFFGKGRLDVVFFVVEGIHERQFVGVQPQALDRVGGLAVLVVADHIVADVAKLDANLVLAA